MERSENDANASSQVNDNLNDSNELISHYTLVFSTNLHLQTKVSMLEAEIDASRRSISTLVQQCQSLRRSNATLQLKLMQMLSEPAATHDVKQLGDFDERKSNSNCGIEELQALEISALKATLKKVLKEKADQMIKFEERMYIQQEEIDDLKNQLRGDQHRNETPPPSFCVLDFNTSNKCGNQHTQNEICKDSYSLVGLKRARTDDWDSANDDGIATGSLENCEMQPSEKQCNLKSIVRSKLEGLRNGKHKENGDHKIMFTF